MKTYLVGGAVRDELLNRNVRDYDYVVVGTTFEDMLARGFSQIKPNFPVFLHPETKDEYAMARIERSTGQGYHDFAFDCSPDVTLEQDLKRRDFTINAIAKCVKTKDIVDPYNGIEDLRNGNLNPVSEDFKDDPVRLVRAARFLANFPNFRPSDKLIDYCKDMTNFGTLSQLSNGKLFIELKKALLSEVPSRFFYFLKDVGALNSLFPYIYNLIDVPQTEKYHPEGCAFTHVMIVLDYAAKTYQGNFEVILSALLHDLGKGITPKEILPRHIGHEDAGIPLVENFCDRFNIPKLARETAIITCRDHIRVHRSLEMKTSKLMALLLRLQVRKNTNAFDIVIAACEADAQGKGKKVEYRQAEFLRGAKQHLESLNLREFAKLRNPATRIHQYKIEQLKTYIREYKEKHNE